jgi:hypothetical protein
VTLLPEAGREGSRTFAPDLLKYREGKGRGVFSNQKETSTFTQQHQAFHAWDPAK